MKANGGHRSGGVYCSRHQVVESRGYSLYCGPDGTAVLEGGDCATGGSHDFREFEETGMFFPSCSLLLHAISLALTRVYVDMGWGRS